MATPRPRSDGPFPPTPVLLTRLSSFLHLAPRRNCHSHPRTSTLLTHHLPLPITLTSPSSPPLAAPPPPPGSPTQHSPIVRHDLPVGVNISIPLKPKATWQRWQHVFEKGMAVLVCGGWAGGRGGWVHVGACENLRATRQNLRAIRQNLRAHPTAPHRPTRLTPRLRPNHIPHPRTFTPHLIPRPPPHVCMCRRSVCGRSMCVWVVRRGGDGAGEVSWGAGGRAGERGE